MPGKLCLPDKWNESFLITLLAKPGKAPCKPENLRPINLLPAEAKLLAKIAADRRLRPYINRAVHSIPQFAYASVRQTSDALDRVLSHCAKIRNKTEGSPQKRLSHPKRDQTHPASWWVASVPRHDQSI